MSEDIELRDKSDDHQTGEENMYANFPSRTPPKKTDPSSSNIVRYRCAVVCLGVFCLLLVIIITALWLKTTSDAKHIQITHNNQLQLLQTTCNDNNTVLEINCSILSREKSQLETKYNTLSSEKSQLETNYSILSSKESSLQEQYGNLNREKSELQDRYDNLARDKSQLQERCDAITAEKDAMWRRFCALKNEITQYAVDVTLDPETAHNNLILSADGKQVKHGDTSQNRPDNPKRFDNHIDVLAKQGFSSGRFYYEVQVSGKTGWYMGVARESTDRKGTIYLSPTYWRWTIWLRDSQYMALADPNVILPLKGKPERVGVFVDYGAGLVSFYDADRWSLIYSYKGVSFREKIYPYFSPYTNDNGKNSAPLVITPVSCFK